MEHERKNSGEEICAPRSWKFSTFSSIVNVLNGDVGGQLDQISVAFVLTWKTEGAAQDYDFKREEMDVETALAQRNCPGDYLTLG